MLHRRHKHSEQSEQADHGSPGDEQVPHHAAGPSVSHHSQESHLFRQKVSSSFNKFILV